MGKGHPPPPRAGRAGPGPPNKQAFLVLEKDSLWWSSALRYTRSEPVFTFYVIADGAGFGLVCWGFFFPALPLRTRRRGKGEAPRERGRTPRTLRGGGGGNGKPAAGPAAPPSIAVVASGGARHRSPAAGGGRRLRARAPPAASPLSWSRGRGRALRRPRGPAPPRPRGPAGAGAAEGAQRNMEAAAARRGARPGWAVGAGR